MTIGNKQKVELKDGTYDAVWSGHNMKILVPDSEPYLVETETGVKGINIEVKVLVVAGKLAWI